MKKGILMLVLLGLLVTLGGGAFVSAAGVDIKLEAPAKTLHVDLMDALKLRQSTRGFAAKEMSWQDLATILWAANGINRQNGKRTAPSAYGKYFIDIYVAANQGLYRYDPTGNLLKWVSNNNIKSQSGTQADIGAASFVLIMVADFHALMKPEERVAVANGTAGTIAENVYLTAAALNLGTRLVASVNVKAIRENLNLNQEQVPLYIMPLGYPKGK